MNNVFLTLAFGATEMMSLFALLYAVVICAVALFVLVMLARFVRASERTAAALEQLARQRPDSR